jgi:hypothetical protein
MIFRLSAKLTVKLKLRPSEVLPPDPNPFADWSAHLFPADRTQYLIISNTASLYSPRSNTARRERSSNR